MENEYKYIDIMDGFFYRITEFLSENPIIMKELQEKEAIFSFLDMEDTDKKKVFFDWFIFDYTSESLSQNFFNYFLERADLPEDLKSLYSRFADNIYSIFEVKALRIGKGMIVYDLINDKEYQVKDTTLTKNVLKGYSLFLRLLPFEDYYILTGMGFGFPPKITPLVKLEIKNIKESKGKFKLTPLVMCNIFFSQSKREKLPPQERLRMLCREGSLDNAYVDKVLSVLKERVKGKGEFDDILADIFKKIKPYSWFKPKELSEAFIETWNSFISEEGEFYEKGPMENALVNVCINYVQNKVNPDNYPNLDRAQKEIDKIQDNWFKSPKEELDGKSPEEVILEERKKLGNPHKEVKFRIEITNLDPEAEIEKKAEKLFYKGLNLATQRKYKEAIAVYQEYLNLNPYNYVVWQNMGISYSMLLDKKNAICCFEKALEINPDYDIAKANLQLTKRATKTQLREMAKNHKVIIRNEGEKEL